MICTIVGIRVISPPSPYLFSAALLQVKAGSFRGCSNGAGNVHTMSVTQATSSVGSS